MMTFGGLGLGLSDEEIREIISIEVAMAMREAISEIFGSIKTDLIEEFDRCFAALPQVAATAVVAAARLQGGEEM